MNSQAQEFSLSAAVFGLGKIGLQYDLGINNQILPGRTLTHCKAISDSIRFHLEYTFDPDTDRCKLSNEIYNVKAFSKLETLLLEPPPDLLVVAAPTDSHRSLIEQILSIWQPRMLILEKPLGVAVADAKQIANLLANTNIVTFVNYSRRFLPNFRAIHNSNAFHARGNLLSVNVHAYGTLLNIYSHFLDLVIYLESRDLIGSHSIEIEARNACSFKFKDLDTLISYAFNGFETEGVDCSMELKYENLTLRMTQNGKLIVLENSGGVVLESYECPDGDFRHYQATVLAQMLVDAETQPSFDQIHDAISIHEFIEAIESANARY